MLTVRAPCSTTPGTKRYKRISRLNIRSSIYDVTDHCNLRCKDSLLLLLGANTAPRQERNRPGRLAGLRPARTGPRREPGHSRRRRADLYLDRVSGLLPRIPSYCATNGFAQAPARPFPDDGRHLSLGDGTTSGSCAGATSSRSPSRHYRGRPSGLLPHHARSPRARSGARNQMTRRIRDAGIKVLPAPVNDEGADGFEWEPARSSSPAGRGPDDLLERYPEPRRRAATTTGADHRQDVRPPLRLERCPSVTETMDSREPRPRRLIRFMRWAKRPAHHAPPAAPPSATPDCTTAKDGAAHRSWVMVNKRGHPRSTRDLQNWIEVYEMFAKLYRSSLVTRRTRAPPGKVCCFRMPDARPVILGCDAVSPLGTDLGDQWRQAPFSGKAASVLAFPPPEGFPVDVAGQVPEFDHSPCPILAPVIIWPAGPRPSSATPCSSSTAPRTHRHRDRPRPRPSHRRPISGTAIRPRRRPGRRPRPDRRGQAALALRQPQRLHQHGRGQDLDPHRRDRSPGHPEHRLRLGRDLRNMGALFHGAGLADVAICGAVDFPLVEPLVAGFATMNGAYKIKPGRPNDPAGPRQPPLLGRFGAASSSPGRRGLALATPDFARAHGTSEPRFELWPAGA